MEVDIRLAEVTNMLACPSMIELNRSQPFLTESYCESRAK